MVNFLACGSEISIYIIILFERSEKSYCSVPTEVDNL